MNYDIQIPYIEIRNKNREIIGLIEGAEIFFEYCFQGCGEFEVYCRMTPNNLALLQKDNYITLPPNDDVKQNAIEPLCNMWIIEKIERLDDKSGGRWITATGREAKQIVDRRIIRTTAKLSGGNKFVSEVKKIFDKNLTVAGIRNISGFVFVDNSEKLSKRLRDDTQVTYDNLLEYTEALFLEYGVGAKLRLDRSDNKMYYEIFSGENKANKLVFSHGNENLYSTNYIEDWTEYKNWALVGGEEDEDEGTRTMVALPHPTYVDSEGNVREVSDVDLREVFVDARDLSSTYEDEDGDEVDYTPEEYLNTLKERGYMKLASENNKKIEFTGEIDTTNTRYRFNIDYYLGDVVKIRDDDFGVETLVRIKKVTKVQNEEGYKEYFEYELYEASQD